MILVRVIERLGGAGRSWEAAPLAIASCGNAALAAAVVAAAAGRRLEVFIPADADPAVVHRLGSLGAALTVCERAPSSVGDPCYQRFVAAVDAGAVPFGCQGTDNGLVIEGGATLAWETAEELAAAGVAPERLIVQVGGGALASACMQGIDEAVALNVLPSTPVYDSVQTVGAYPLARAHAAVASRIRGGAVPDVALREAAHHRSGYMWPWETRPTSVAHGIIDDETYDWAAVVGGMVRTGGSVIVVDEQTLVEANDLARQTTGINVDHTGSAGLAGLLARSRSGVSAGGTDVVVVFSGASR
jgi:threonine synthase